MFPTIKTINRLFFMSNWFRVRSLNSVTIIWALVLVYFKSKRYEKLRKFCGRSYVNFNRDVYLRKKRIQFCSTFYYRLGRSIPPPSSLPYFSFEFLFGYPLHDQLSYCTLFSCFSQAKCRLIFHCKQLSFQLLFLPNFKLQALSSPKK